MEIYDINQFDKGENNFLQGNKYHKRCCLMSLQSDIVVITDIDDCDIKDKIIL